MAIESVSGKLKLGRGEGITIALYAFLLNYLLFCAKNSTLVLKVCRKVGTVIFSSLHVFKYAAHGEA